MRPSVPTCLLVGVLALLACTPAVAADEASVAEGQKLAFDRGKGNCLSCHEIKGGDLPGTIGPPLAGLKGRYPDRAEVVAIVEDETKRNPETIMPPFGRNLILTDREIQSIVDFLYSL